MLLLALPATNQRRVDLSWRPTWDPSAARRPGFIHFHWGSKKGLKAQSIPVCLLSQLGFTCLILFGLLSVTKKDKDEKETSWKLFRSFLLRFWLEERLRRIVRIYIYIETPDRHLRIYMHMIHISPWYVQSYACVQDNLRILHVIVFEWNRCQSSKCPMKLIASGGSVSRAALGAWNRVSSLVFGFGLL